MTAPVPIRQIAHLRLALPSHHKWATGLGWVPVSPTEIHLTSRYFPIVIRLSGSRPFLGLLLDPRYLARPLVNQEGAWQGAYMPIALRCFPFEAPTIDKDPLQDLLISPDCSYLVAAGGQALVEQNGQPSGMVTEVHRLFRLLRDGQETLATAVDRLMIGDLLVALNNPETDAPSFDPPLYTIDRTRFSQLDRKALAAMARQNFLTVDVAVACMFSQQQLKRDCLAKTMISGEQKAQEHATPPATDLVGIADFSLALDDGELISLDDIYAMRAGFTVPAETAPEQAATAVGQEPASTLSDKQTIAPDRDLSDAVPDIGQLLREAAAKLGREAASRSSAPPPDKRSEISARPESTGYKRPAAAGSDQIPAATRAPPSDHPQTPDIRLTLPRAAGPMAKLEPRPPVPSPVSPPAGGPRPDQPSGAARPDQGRDQAGVPRTGERASPGVQRPPELPAASRGADRGPTPERRLPTSVGAGPPSRTAAPSDQRPPIPPGAPVPHVTSKTRESAPVDASQSAKLRAPAPSTSGVPERATTPRTTEERTLRDVRPAPIPTPRPGERHVAESGRPAAPAARDRSEPPTPLRTDRPESRPPPHLPRGRVEETPRASPRTSERVARLETPRSHKQEIPPAPSDRPPSEDLRRSPAGSTRSEDRQRAFSDRSNAPGAPASSHSPSAATRAPAARPKPAATDAKKSEKPARTSDKAPEISELIRKLDDLQKLLRLD